MGFFFTCLYIFVTLLSPGFLLGGLGNVHPEVILASLATICSIPALLRSKIFGTVSSFAVVALSIAVALSILASTHWISGAVSSLYYFLPQAFLFFLVAVHCKRRWHFQWIVFILVGGCLFFLFEGARDLHNGAVISPYLYGDERLQRLRGLGFLADPNDLGQLMVSLLPLLFLWRRWNVALDMVIIGIPTALLLTGIYLTHSRGALLALVAVLLVVSRRKIGVIPAAGLAAICLAGFMALGFTGGRSISVDSGADRLELWSNGLQMLKHHPFFGVGSGNFTDYSPLTAHNSIVLCSAETGMVGLFFWVLLMFSTLRSAVRLGAEPKVVKEYRRPELYTPQVGTTIIPRALAKRMSGSLRASVEARSGVPEPIAAPPGEDWAAPEPEFMQMTERDVRSIGRLLVYALTGFFTAGWFLSRAFSAWLFIYCGMICAIVGLARDRGIAPPKDRVSFLFIWSAVIAVLLIASVWLIMRLRGFV
jgi:O-antigen ligase